MAAVPLFWDTNMAAVKSCENTPFAIKICLRHQSVTPFLSGATSPQKSPGSAPELSELTFKRRPCANLLDLARGRLFEAGRFLNFHPFQQ